MRRVQANDVRAPAGSRKQRLELRAVKKSDSRVRPDPGLALATTDDLRISLSSFWRIIRASEWWGYKLAPILAAQYATGYLLKLPLISLWPIFLLTLAAIAPCAAYVSIINDLTDVEDDLASGKVNRLVGRSLASVSILLASCILPGIAVAIYLRNEPLLLILYLGAWAAFTFYSIPPVRLKGRGGFGLLADAGGAHLFPTLFAVYLVYRSCDERVDPVWFALIAVWSLSCGLRGILWHQLTDIDNDRKINLSTFARRHDLTMLGRLSNFVFFPVELAALALMLWRLRSVVAALFIIIYALFEFLRGKFWKLNFVVAVPKPRFRIVLLEYYELFFPLAIILSSAMRNPADALLIAFHLAVFPRRVVQTAKESTELVAGMRRRSAAAQVER